MQELMARHRARGGARIGFVPTMGCLHAGHLSLIREVVQRGLFPVVSIFVNPLQFGPSEDFGRYPRPFDQDRRLCEETGVACLFAPSPDEMYAAGPSVYVDEGDLSLRLCGASRPGHFRGVLTVVAKLFNIVQPHVAVFGRKDAQQARLIEVMVESLNIPVELVVAPIVREADGLAMSSRNRYLSAEERREALCVYAALSEAASLYRAGERAASRAIESMASRIGDSPRASVDYIAVVDYRSLCPVEVVGPGTLYALAVRIGGTRLIDNMLIRPDGEPAL